LGESQATAQASRALDPPMTPWIHEIAEYSHCLKNLHFRPMIVKDSNLELLAKTCGHVL